MAENIAVTLSRKIIIGVVCQINNGGFVRFSLIAELQLIVRCECKSDTAGKIARIAFFTVLADVAEFYHSLLVVSTVAIRFPDHFIETLQAAMQGIAIIVGRQFVFDSFKCKLGSADSVGVPAHRHSEVRVTCQVSV